MNSRSFETEYGEGSFTRHHCVAESLGMTFTVVRTPGGGLDIDEPDDLVELVERIQPHDARQTYAFLESSELLGHLRRATGPRSSDGPHDATQTYAGELSL